MVPIICGDNIMVRHVLMIRLQFVEVLFDTLLCVLEVCVVCLVLGTLSDCLPFAPSSFSVFRTTLAQWPVLHTVALPYVIGYFLKLLRRLSMWSMFTLFKKWLCCCVSCSCIHF